EVPGQRARPLAGRAPSGTSADPLCPRGVHAAQPTRAARLAEQERDLWTVVSRQRRDVARRGARPAASRRRDRLLQRAAHLESETAAPPALALHRSSRRLVT